MLLKPGLGTPQDESSKYSKPCVLVYVSRQTGMLFRFSNGQGMNYLYGNNQLASRHNKLPFAFRAPLQFSPEWPLLLHLELLHLNCLWLLGLLLSCQTWNQEFCLLKQSNKTRHMASLILDCTYLTKATPLGIPVTLSFKIFFWTMYPYGPNMLSNSSSVILFGKFVTYKLVSFMSSPAGLA